MKNKLECIVVLGFGLQKKGKVPNILKSRLDAAIELYRNNLCSKLIMTGGLSNKNWGMTEAEGMRRYAIQKGVGKEDILKEEASTDTIGNAYFLKQRILKPNKWKNLAVVTSDFHLERSKIIFKKVLGKNYRINFIGTKAFSIPMFFYTRLGLEKEFIELTKIFFKGIEDGNDDQIKKLIKRLHPLYSGKALKQLAKLSDKELSKKFGIDEELIKKVRGHIEKRIRLTGKG
jgi:uncharacterized SAM-binding protein YcdF (DUF218 family)